MNDWHCSPLFRLTPSFLQRHQQGQSLPPMLLRCPPTTSPVFCPRYARSPSAGRCHCLSWSLPRTDHNFYRFSHPPQPLTPSPFFHTSLTLHSPCRITTRVTRPCGSHFFIRFCLLRFPLVLPSPSPPAPHPHPCPVAHVHFPGSCSLDSAPFLTRLLCQCLPYLWHKVMS